MKQILLLVLLSFLVSSFCSAQFQKTYGSPNGDDIGYAAIQTSDGGYAVAGYTQTLGAGDDILVLKLNDIGEVEWSRAFGGSEYEEGKDIIQTADGGFVIGGVGDSYGSGSEDFYLIKTDAAGNLDWFKTFGGPSSEYFEDMTMSPDGGFVLVGTSLGFYNYGPWDIFIVKTDNDGTLQWSKQIDLTGTVALGAEEGFAVDVTSDGGYIVSTEPEHLNNSGSSGGDVCLLKLDSAGEVLWYSTAINNINPPSEWDFGYSISETSDNGFIVGGTTSTFNSGSRIALHKVDSTGIFEWSRFYNLQGRDLAYSSLPVSTGGYAIAGGNHAFTDSGDVALIITNDTGSTTFIAGYGGEGDDFAFSIYETSDAAFVMAGRSNSFSANGDYDVYLLKTDYGGGMKICPQKDLDLIEALLPVESNDPVITSSEPATVAGIEVISNNAASVSVEWICPLPTEIEETLQEKEITIPTLLEMSQPLQLHAFYEYQVINPDGRFMFKGYGSEIKFTNPGFYVVILDGQLFKVVVAEK